MFNIDIYTTSEAETTALGAKLSHIAQQGDCFALFGTLGMGKSVLARAFIQSACGDVDVPSPTFTLVQLYDAPDFCIYHFDLYRLKSAEEIFELGMGQSDDVKTILDSNGFKNIEIIKDLAGIERVISGKIR